MWFRKPWADTIHTCCLPETSHLSKEKGGNQFARRGEWSSQAQGNLPKLSLGLNQNACHGWFSGWKYSPGLDCPSSRSGSLMPLLSKHGGRGVLEKHCIHKHGHFPLCQLNSVAKPPDICGPHVIWRCHQQCHPPSMNTNTGSFTCPPVSWSPQLKASVSCACLCYPVGLWSHLWLQCTFF